MDIRFISPDFSLSGIADDALEVSVIRRFGGSGTMKAVLPLTTKNVSSAKCGAYIIAHDTSYIIETVACDHENGTVSVSCSELSSILRYTAVESPAKFKGTLSEIVSGILARYVSLSFPISISAPYSSRFVWFTDYGSIEDNLFELAEYFGYSFSLAIDPDAGRCVLKLGSKSDRTADIIISEELGTAKLVSSCHDLSRYYNRVVVLGDDAPSSMRAAVPVNAEDCDFDDGFDDSEYPRRTLCIERKSITKAAIAEDGGSIEIISIAERLAIEGKRELAKHRPVLSFSYDLILPSFSLSPGDKVKVRCDSLGVFRDATAREIKYSEKNGLSSTLVTFLV